MVTSLAQILRDNSSSNAAMMEGEESDWQEDDELVEGELISLLATGCTSPGMRAFLANTLGEHNIKRLAKAVDTALESVHTIMLDMVKASLESVAFILGDVKDLLGNESDAGLSTKELNEAEFLVAMVILQCESLRTFVESYQLSLRTLFNWLLRVWHQQEGGVQSAYTSVAIEASEIPSVFSLLTQHLLTNDMILPDLQENNPIGARAASLEALFGGSGKDATAVMELMFSKPSQEWTRLPLRRQFDSFSLFFAQIKNRVLESLSSQIRCQEVPIGEGALICSHSSMNENQPSSIQVLVAFEERIVVCSIGLGLGGQAISQTIVDIQTRLLIESASFYSKGLIFISPSSSDDPSKTTRSLIYLPQLDSPASIKTRTFNNLPASSQVLLAVGNTRGTGLFAFFSCGAEKEESGAWLLDLEEDEEVE
jgi:hypothetical protein